MNLTEGDLKLVLDDVTNDPIRRRQVASLSFQDGKLFSVSISKELEVSLSDFFNACTLRNLIIDRFQASDSFFRSLFNVCKNRIASFHINKVHVSNTVLSNDILIMLLSSVLTTTVNLHDLKLSNVLQNPEEFMEILHNYSRCFAGIRMLSLAKNDLHNNRSLLDFMKSLLVNSRILHYIDLSGNPLVYEDDDEDDLISFLLRSSNPLLQTPGRLTSISLQNCEALSSHPNLLDLLTDPCIGDSFIKQIDMRGIFFEDDWMAALFERLCHLDRFPIFLFGHPNVDQRWNRGIQVLGSYSSDLMDLARVLRHLFDLSEFVNKRILPHDDHEPTRRGQRIKSVIDDILKVFYIAYDQMNECRRIELCNVLHHDGKSYCD